MKKPTITQTLHKIALILYSVGMGCQCLFSVFRVPLRLVNRGYPVDVSAGAVVLWLVQVLLYAPLAFLAFRNSKPGELTEKSAKTNAIVLISVFIGTRLLGFGAAYLGARLMDTGAFGGYNMMAYLLQIFGYCYTAAILLMFCAAVIELRTSMPSLPDDLTNRMAKWALIGLGACVVLKCLLTMLPNPVLSLFSRSGLMLPVKWRLLLIGEALVSLLPLGILALWCWRNPAVTKGRALTKIILAPVIFYVLDRIVEKLFQYAFVPQIMSEGTATYGAYSLVQGVSSLPNLIGYAAFVLICCAGAIELYQIKHPSSDGDA